MAQESIESSTIILRPVDEVFAFVENPENSPLWEGVESKKLVGGLKPGSNLTVITALMGKRVEARATLIDVEFNRLTRCAAESPFPHVIEHHYEAVDGATKFTRRLLTDPKEASGFAKFAQPLMMNMVVKSTRKSVAELKRILESRDL